MNILARRIFIFYNHVTNLKHWSITCCDVDTPYIIQNEQKIVDPLSPMDLLTKFVCMKMPRINASKGILFSFLVSFIFSCSSNNTGVEDSLVGVWLRSDGTYRIEITEVKDDGKLFAKYFNPDPINVGKSGWRIENDELQIFVELSDENYPGSIYKLTYDDVSDMLTGTYYQAVAKQTYEVSFNKFIN